MQARAARWYLECRFWVSKLKPTEIKKILAREASIEPDKIRIDDTPVDIQKYRQEKPPAATIDIGATAPSVGESAEERARGRYLLAISKPLESQQIDQSAIDELARQFGLYPHQAQAVAHLWSQSGSLLADDMDPGKTRSAAIAAKLAGYPVVVLCHASLKLNWKKELMLCGESSDAIGFIDGSRQPVPQARWIFLNYENLDVLLQAAGFSRLHA
jgi:hypothetical protein